MNQSLHVKAKCESENTIAFRLPKKGGDYGVAESWTQKVVLLVNFKSIFGYIGSDELMISSIRPFSSDRFFLFDLESLNENYGVGESKDTHPYIYIYKLGSRPKSKTRTCSRTNTWYHRGLQL